MIQSVSLGTLGTISQGLTVGRYLAADGSPVDLVQPRNLDYLEVTEPLEKVILKGDVLSRYTLHSNDVVFSIRGQFLKASLVTPAISGAICGQNLAFFRSSSDLLYSSFLCVLWRLSFFQQILSGLGGQSSTTRILSLQQLRKLEIPLLSIEEQQKIANYYWSIEELARDTYRCLEQRQLVADLMVTELLKGTNLDE